MFNSLSLDRYYVGIPVIILGILLAITCQTLLKKYLGKETIKECHEVGGYYLAIVGTFYAVLVGLVVVDTLSRFQKAEMATELEGKSIIAMHTIIKQFPEKEKEIKGSLKEYTDEVINVEWKSMEKHEYSAKAHDLLFKVINSVISIEPKTENQKALYPIITNELINFWENRRTRTRATNLGLPVAEWTVLILGASITIIFTYFFFIESHFVHLLMTGMMTLLVSMSLYLILLFSEPYSGDLKVSDKSFVLARTLIREQP